MTHSGKEAAFGDFECNGDFSPVETIARGLDYFRLADHSRTEGLSTIELLRTGSVPNVRRSV
jgi:hypothetical protein